MSDTRRDEDRGDVELLAAFGGEEDDLVSALLQDLGEASAVAVGSPGDVEVLVDDHDPHLNASPGAGAGFTA